MMPRDTTGKAQKPETAMEAAGMAHMERTKAEKKELSGAQVAESSGPDYPYGLRIHLDHEGMKKIGMADLPEVGGEVHIHAKAHVVSARSEKREGGEERHTEFQITHMRVNPQTDEDQTGGTKKAPGAGHVTDKGKDGGDKKKESGTGKDAFYGRKRS